MSARFRRSLSSLVGWFADRRVPTPLRSFVYRSYARATGADPSEAELGLDKYPSLGAFFVRRLRPGARTVDAPSDRLVSPCDGKVQAFDRVASGALLQAKGRAYSVDELLAGAADTATLDGAWSWTIYLGPKDYHRVHAPLGGELVDVRWVPGDRFSVAPNVLERRDRVLAVNERAVLVFETERGPYYLVMVGALNVGRIRVVGVEPGAPPREPKRFERAEELARFEMGSTVVLVLPAEFVAEGQDFAASEVGREVRLGDPLAELCSVEVLR